MSAELFVKKCRYLRKKYLNNRKLNDILSNIIWFSYDIVYPDTLYFRAYKNNLKDYMVDYRIYKSCEKIINTPHLKAYMLTLTFDDYHLTLSPRTINDYVKQYTQMVCYDGYIFADYGKKNNRKHYHVIMCTYEENVSMDDMGHLRLPIDWECGFYNLTPITDNNAVRYAKKAFRYAKKSNGERWKMRKSKEFIYPVLLQPYMNPGRFSFVDGSYSTFF